MTPLTQGQKRRHYFIGLGVGLIPMIIFLVNFGWLTGAVGSYSALFDALPVSALAALLYVVEFIVTLIFLNQTNKQNRFAGYGLLTAFLVSPVVVAIGCTVIPNLIQPH